MSIRQIVGELLPYAAAAAVALFSYLAILAAANTQRYGRTYDRNRFRLFREGAVPPSGRLSKSLEGATMIRLSSIA